MIVDVVVRDCDCQAATTVIIDTVVDTTTQWSKNDDVIILPYSV